MGRRIFIRDTRVRAHQMATVIFYLVALVIFYRHHPFTVLHRCRHGVFQALLVNLLHHDFIHHDFNIVHLVTIHAHPDRDFPYLSIHAG